MAAKVRNIFDICKKYLFISGKFTTFVAKINIDMTNKEEYAEFSAHHGDMPIFMQAWWMDAVCAGKEWDAILVRTPENKIMAVMPYLIRQRLGVRYILMPQETQIGGVWVDEEVRQLAGAGYDDIARSITRELANLNLAYYYQQYPVESMMPEAMQRAGFKLKERTTYRVSDLSNLDDVIDRFSKNKKRQLQKALALHADRGMNIEDFYRFHVECLAQQKKKINYTREFLLVLERKTTREKRSEILAIRNADGHLCAAAFLVWDDKHMYYLIPCYSPRYKDTGAGALLILEAMKLAREKGVNFDFEGSMDRGTANHYRQFGSDRKIYYGVRKIYKWWMVIALLINKLRNIHF